MKRFKSKMDSLRRVREQTELLAKMTTAVRQQEVVQAEHAVEEQKRKLEQHFAHGRNSLEEGLQGSMLEAMLTHQQQALNSVQTARQDQVAATRSLQNAVDQHAQARADLKIVDKLIDRESQEHRRQQMLAEEHTQSETASQAFHRRNSDGQETES
jgi:flagellar biosynthesis chaperone FliJ